MSPSFPGSYVGAGLSTILRLCGLSCRVVSEYMYFNGAYLFLAQALQEKQMEATWPFLADL